MLTNYTDLIQGERIRGALYNDPDIFQQEIETIWNKVWVFLGHDSEIAEPGAYVRRKIGDQPVLMARGSDGVVRVFYNRCRHRGGMLCHQNEGKAARFMCPYHAWTYANTGALIAPAHRDGLGPDFDRTQFSLTEVARVELYRGMVFASLSPTGISLDAHLGQMKEYIDMIFDLSPTGEIETRAGTQKTRYRGNWKFLPENTMEGDHHGGAIHKIAFDLFSKRTGFDVSQVPEGDVIKSVPGGHMIEDYRDITLPAPPPGFKPSAARMAYREMLVKAHGPEKAHALLTKLPPLIYIFPNVLYVITHFRRIEPVSVDETFTYYTPVFFKGAPDEINEGRLREHEFAAGAAGFVSPDDIEIMERNQLATHATGNDWLYIGRGIHREKRLNDGGTSGKSMDENHLRAFWRHYHTLMEQA